MTGLGKTKPKQLGFELVAKVKPELESGKLMG